MLIFLNGVNILSTSQETKDKVESFIYNYPICEYYFLELDDLIFSDKVRYICEQECRRYNHSWACPPAIPPISQCIEECHKYNSVFLFTSVAEVFDCLNFEECLEAKRAHEQMSYEIREEFKERFGDVLALTTGCKICDECTYPNEPCRHPDKRLSTIESHGILIMQIANELGICYDCGNNMVTYFSLIFFNE